MDNTFNKEAHNANYKESMTINFPIDIKYINHGDVFSVHVPMIDVFFSAKTIEDVERKARAMVAIWIEYNLEKHMRNLK